MIIPTFDNNGNLQPYKAIKISFEMTRTEELHLRIAVTLDRIEMVNGMIKRTKEYMPDDIFLLKDHEGIRQEMVNELYAMFSELGLDQPLNADKPVFMCFIT